MPSRPRREIFDPHVIGVYHAFNKVVQGQFLLGPDQHWGQDFGYRKEWFRKELKVLAQAMAFDFLDYALLDNHFHLLVRNRPDLRDIWTDLEVVRRWNIICPQSFDEQGNPVEPTQWQLQLWAQNQERVSELRRRLGDLSWLMAMVQQRVARRSNLEQKTTGSHFWSGRFKAKRIEDDAGLLTCSLYINLNPWRAGITHTWADPSYTSLFERIRASWNATWGELYEPPGTDDTSNLGSPNAAGLRQPQLASPPPTSAAWLAEMFIDERSAAYVSPTASDAEHASEAASQPLEQSVLTTEPPPVERASNKGYLPLSLPDYVALMRWTISRLRGDTKSKCAATQRILQRAGWDPDFWICTIQQAIHRMARLLGTSLAAIPPAPT